MDPIKRLPRKDIKQSGWPQPPIPLIEEVLKEALTADERQLFFDLTDLAEKEEALCQKINGLEPVPGGVLFRGGALVVCEDEDDFAVISAGPRNELKGVQKEMAALLGKLLDAGLGTLGIVQRQCENYKVIP
jgi:hypothetical protein